MVHNRFYTFLTLWIFKIHNFQNEYIGKIFYKTVKEFSYLCIYNILGT